MILRRADTDKAAMMSFLAAHERRGGFQGCTLAGAGVGGFGFAWGLALQVVGWVLNGIGLGMSVADAISEARKKKDIENPGATLGPAELISTAQGLAAADPTHSVEDYLRMLNGEFGPDAPTCPAGFYLDPGSKTCVPIRKPSMFASMPTWGWFMLGVGGFFVVTQMGILKVGR